MSEKIQKTPRKILYGNIKGTVVGYDGNEFTRPIYPANVILLIHVIDKKEKLYYPIPEKELGILKKYKIHGVEDLVKDHPDIYEIIFQQKTQVNPYVIEDKNNLGRFEFNQVPSNGWCYVAAAVVEDKLYKHTDKMGNNGFGESKVISYDLMKEMQTIDGVVIPVKDQWIKKDKAPDVKVIETDENMDDPNHLKNLLGED